MTLRVTKLEIDALIFRMSHPDVIVASFKSFPTCSKDISHQAEKYPRIPGPEAPKLSFLYS